MDLSWLWVVLPGLGVFALVGGLIWRSRQQAAARRAALEARGWRYEPRSGGFAVIGGDGVPWTLTVTRSRSSQGGGGSSHTLWEAPAEPIDDIVLAGPKPPPLLAGLDLGGDVVQAFLRALLGAQAAADLARARPLELGTGAFRERFAVMASSEALAAEVLDEETRRALLRAPEGVVLLRWRDTLQIRLSRGAYDPDEIAALVALGEEVAERCGYGAPSAR